MSLYADISAASLAARKTKSPMASALVTLKAECARIGKDAGGRDPTDDECVKVIRKFLAGVNESLPKAEGARLDLLRLEQEMYQDFLPQPLEGAALAEAVKQAAADAGVTIEARSTGAIKALLNERFPGRVDGRALADTIKSLG